MILVTIDTETTGFVDPEHRIVEVYMDLIDMSSKTKLSTLNQRINPKRPIPAEAQRVHGISGADLVNCPDWESFGPLLHTEIHKAQLFVAHNAKFDFEFLNMEFRRIGLSEIQIPYFCTMDNGRWAAPTGKSPSLQELCFACEVIYDPSLAHAADYDVQVMRECLFRGVQWEFFDLNQALLVA